MARRLRTPLLWPGSREWLPNTFVVLPLGVSTKPQFIHYVEQHGDLHGMLSILENMGYLIDVTPGNVPISRMTEKLVELVRRYG